jgi:DNA-nicking Smr family endonuclease
VTRRKDESLWERVAESIAPLPQRSKRRTGKLPVPSRVPEKPAKPVKAHKPAKPKPAAPKPAPLPELSHTHAPGLDARSHEKLRKGKLPIEGRLDLHGHTLEAAHRALAEFVNRSFDAEKRAVLVITGKGGRGRDDGAHRATLRESVPRWLNEPALRRRILAFTQAQPQHGGAGALYVLLKRRR